MKPRPADEIRRLVLNLDKLGAALRHALDESEQASLEREKLLQEQWRLQREAATQRRAAQDYETLLAEHETLQNKSDDVKQTLRQIRDWAKNARREITP